MENYDLVIIGAGPAGLSAAIYAGQIKIKTVVLGYPELSQAARAHRIENYAGILQISGPEILQKMEEQVKKAGVEIKREEVISMDVSKKIVKTHENEYSSKAILIATGKSYSALKIPGEKEFVGKGVSYCALCDAAFFKGKKVAVVGGGNSALSDAIFLKKYAKEIYLIHRRDELLATKAYEEEAKKERIVFKLSRIPEKIQGTRFVEKIILKNLKEEKVEELEVDGVFVSIGSTPVSALAENAGIRIDEKKSIMVNRDQETNIKGVFAAGDVTGGVNQIIVAAGDGARAAVNAKKWIEGDKRI